MRKNSNPEKMNMIKVSIIMPVYNSEKYLLTAVRSVLSQDFEEFELILVDDGATDASGEICNQLADSDVRIRVVHKRNGGICSARNIGIELAKGEYIGFCDNDDKFLPNLLKDNYAIGKEYNADIVRFKRKRVKTNSKGKREVDVNFIPSGVHSFCGSEIDQNYPCIRRCGYAVWSALYKKTFIESHQLRFCEKAKSGEEDQIFNIKAYQYCDCIVLNSKVYYEWIRREEHSTSDKFNMNIISTMYYSIKVEYETYLIRNVEKYAKGYWSNIVLFYLYFCFWNLNRKCCNLNVFQKIHILKDMRINPYLIKYLNEESYKKITDSNKLGKVILQCYYKKHFILLYYFLMIRNQEY